jgi:hypothetical protein
MQKWLAEKVLKDQCKEPTHKLKISSSKIKKIALKVETQKTFFENSRKYRLELLLPGSI